MKPGLGVTREAIQGVFEQADMGFTFQESPPLKGKPRTLGTSPNGLTHIELVGHPSNLSLITMLAGTPSDSYQANVLNSIWVLGLLTHLVPDWIGADGWLTTSAYQIANGAGEQSITQHYRFAISPVLPFGFTLTVRPPKPPKRSKGFG